MPVIVGTDAGEQFVDASNENGDMVLIEEMDNETAGRCGWTVVEDGCGAA